MPSVSSSSMPKVLDSSTVTVPSLPTLSMASASTSPMAVSAAEMEATCAISVLPPTSVDCLAMLSTAALTPLSIPRLSSAGAAPAATLRRPSAISDWASTVAVVVPSPATSLVLVATSLTSCAPMFSNGSSSSTSRATDTPSLVMVGAPNFFSITTLRPLGPRVTFTVSASLLTPASSPRRADSSNFRILGMTLSNSSRVPRVWRVRKWRPPGRSRRCRGGGRRGNSGQLGQVVALDGDLGAAVLGVDDGVADGHVHRDDLAGVLGAAARADGDDLALLGLLLGRVGDDQARGHGLLGLAGADDDPVIEGVQLHREGPPWLFVSTLVLRVPT